MGLNVVAIVKINDDDGAYRNTHGVKITNLQSPSDREHVSHQQ